jgi:nucleoid DNA-binding protein
MAKKLTKAQVIQSIADTAGEGITKAIVKEVLAAMASVASQQLRTVGQFDIPDIARMRAKIKPATPARQGTNPFTKQPMTFAAKAASTVVKIAPVVSFKNDVSR